MNLELQGKKVLVTGASKGIGAGTARVFAREGCELVLVARSAEGLAEISRAIRRECGTAVETVAADLATQETLSRFEHMNDVDILINNAGDIPGGDLQSVSAEKWHDAWQVKVLGYIDLCRLFYRKMKARGSGVILNNIGASAELLDPTYIAGSTGNAGLVAFTRALGSRSLDDGIRVVGISPGPVATERVTRLLHQRGGSADSATARFPLGRAASVDEIADAILFLASPRSAYTSGVVLTVDGGLSARRGV